MDDIDKKDRDDEKAEANKDHDDEDEESHALMIKESHNGIQILTEKKSNDQKNISAPVEANKTAQD